MSFSLCICTLCTMSVKRIHEGNQLSGQRRKTQLHTEYQKVAPCTVCVPAHVRSCLSLCVCARAQVRVSVNCKQREKKTHWIITSLFIYITWRRLFQCKTVITNFYILHTCKIPWRYIMSNKAWGYMGGFLVTLNFTLESAIFGLRISSCDKMNLTLAREHFLVLLHKTLYHKKTPDRSCNYIIYTK